MNASLKPGDINPTLIALGESPIKQNCSAKEILKRPAVNINHLPLEMLGINGNLDCPPFILNEMMMEAETVIKYAGYIARQLKQLKQLSKQEHKRIPVDFNYLDISSLSKEAREKLSFVRPETLGQAMRISGVTPADASVLAVYLSR